METGTCLSLLLDFSPATFDHCSLIFIEDQLYTRLKYFDIRKEVIISYHFTGETVIWIVSNLPGFTQGVVMALN